MDDNLDGVLELQDFDSAGDRICLRLSAKVQMLILSLSSTSMNDSKATVESLRETVRLVPLGSTLLNQVLKCMKFLSMTAQYC